MDDVESLLVGDKPTATQLSTLVARIVCLSSYLNDAVFVHMNT